MLLGGWGRRALFALAVMWIGGCGGGGGGSEPVASPEQSVRLTNVRVAQNVQKVFEGDRLDDVVITADVVGDLSKLSGQTLFVLIEDGSGLFSATPRFSPMPNGVDNRVELLGLPTTGRVGSYRSPLRVRVCLDNACHRPINGSPVNVPLQIDVVPPLRFVAQGPLVIDVPFGAAPAPSSFKVHLPEGMSSFEWEWVPPPRLYEIGFTPGVSDSLDLTVTRLPVGTHRTQVAIKGFATIGNVSRLMWETREVEIRVHAVPGVTGGFFPERLDLQTYRSAGLASPITGDRTSLVVLADGTRYTHVSRIVYLPPGPQGNADARGIDWLHVWVDTLNPHEPEPVRVMASPFACVSPDGRTISCLEPGRYEAWVYLRTADGRELSTPLRVSNQVHP